MSVDRNLFKAKYCHTPHHHHHHHHHHLYRNKAPTEMNTEEPLTWRNPINTAPKAPIEEKTETPHQDDKPPPETENKTLSVAQEEESVEESEEEIDTVLYCIEIPLPAPPVIKSKEIQDTQEMDNTSSEVGVPPVEVNESEVQEPPEPEIVPEVKQPSPPTPTKPKQTQPKQPTQPPKKPVNGPSQHHYHQQHHSHQYQQYNFTQAAAAAANHLAQLAHQQQIQMHPPPQQQHYHNRYPSNYQNYQEYQEPPPPPPLPQPPLPNAIIPLPLDPNYPPTVLSSYPNTPNTQSTSGYSTAGHSRSSSPMGNTGGGYYQGGYGDQMGGNSGMLPVPLLSPVGNSGGVGGGYTPNYILEAASAELSNFSSGSTVNGQFVVHFHINAGVSVSFTVGEQVQVVKGPMTVPLVATNSNPPLPLPIQVPQGHVVQQIVDENGTLRHVIVSHQPPLMPIPNYGPSSQSQQFYPNPGYPTGHYQPMQVPLPVQSPHQGPTPQPNYPSSIPLHNQKDDRAQRQQQRMKNKVNAKLGFTNNNGSQAIHYTQPPPPPQQTRKPTPKSPQPTPHHEEDGSIGSTGSVTSTGTQEEEEETRTLLLTEMLSSIISPTVTEITSKSAYIKWSHPDRITDSGENKFPDFSDISDNDFRYEVLISDSIKGHRYRPIFEGSALSCRVKDLKPGSSYAIAYHAIWGESKGARSDSATFVTLASEPEPPSGIECCSRSRGSLTLKWFPPVCDNGAKVNVYLLEYDEGREGDEFVEVYRGRNKSFTVGKLTASWSYRFRVAAGNEVGMSLWSEIVTISTSGSPPPQPLPPTIAEAGVKYLRLEWIGRDTDDGYSLQMEDPTTGHGFRNIYNGNAPNYLQIGLRRNTQYKFRLRAHNEEGDSKYSEETQLSTLPDRPCPPHKPTLKGRTHSHSFKVRWDPPTDTGGVPLTAYSLEIDQNGSYEEIYRGTETEFTVDRLSPGQSYALRVIGIGPGGASDPSELCVITTEPVCPGKCSIPKLCGKPKANSVHLKWSAPEVDGGSPVISYEVGCTTPDNQTQQAYSGKETECIVSRLLPGRAYLFQIRAFNRIGSGGWSDPLEIVSGAGSPDPPSLPKITNKSTHIVSVGWGEPLNNGSAISEYRVQMAMVDSEEKSTFSQVYLGASNSCEVKGLSPACVYLFRVQAVNGAGISDWSGVTTHKMPESSPGMVVGVEGTSTCSSISLRWKVPGDNGGVITHYNVLVGENVVVASSNFLVLENLMPDTHYKIRVQGVNNIGPGAYSTPLKIGTKPLPPLPPKLECVSTAHFWMKLKWVDISSKNTEYLVQMINPYKDEFEVVYRGSTTNCKVTRLQEDTEYQFRICALNGAGMGEFSELYSFSTSKAPPGGVKGLKVELQKDSHLHKFEWLKVSSKDTLEYQLQVANKKKDGDFKTLYRGVEQRCEIPHTKLEEGNDYISRVCAVRVCEEGGNLVGPYSTSVNFHVPHSTVREESSRVHSSSNHYKTGSGNTFYQACQEFLGTISYESRVGIVAVVALIILAFVISLITHHVVS